MKKVLSYILISFIISVNLFAPFSVNMGDKNNIKINNNKAEAVDKSGVNLNAETYANDKNIIVYAIANFEHVSWWTSDNGIIAILSDPDGIVVKSDGEMEKYDPTDIEVSDQVAVFKSKGLSFDKIYKITFNNLKPSTTYDLNLFAKSDYKSWATSVKNIFRITTTVGSLGIVQLFNDGNNLITLEGSTTNQAEASVKITTLEEGKTTIISGGNSISATNSNFSNLPACGVTVGGFGTGTLGGCIAQGLYYLLFVPSSYLFALSGVFFDHTFAYSVQDTSYRSAFVVQGWGLVRDFCNIFFIFILLYIAISTILDVHEFKTKDAIVNVVIVGLLINFSLFAAQVIIDASNVTARVFYNEKTIQVTEGGDTGATDATDVVSKVGPDGIIPLSAALVNKVNPQNLIIHYDKINDVATKGNVKTTDTAEKGGVGAGAFIVIVLLASAVNIAGFIVFLSVGLIFVSRVIGLWIAMILAPLAFFTYIIPSFAKTKTIGWENWWPETLKLAFLAPVFMFFLYIILKFLELDLISDPLNKQGLEFFIATLIPFVFIIILMFKAKKIASDMSGELGQQITGGVAAAGGMLLGGAALGGALLGKRVIGQTIAKASRGDTATQKYQAALGDPVAMAKLTNWQKLKGGIGSAVGMGKIYGTDKGNVDPATGKPIGVEGGIGGALNKKQKAVGEVDAARHKEDEIKKASGLEGVDNNKLSGTDVGTMEGKFKETERSAAEAAARKGVDAKGKEILIKNTAGTSFHGEDEFKKAEMEKQISDKKAVGNPDDFVVEKIRDKKGNIIREERTDQLKPEVLDKIKNDINVKLNTAVKVTVDDKLAKDFVKMRETAAKHVNPISRVVAGSNKGSYDLRKLSDLKSDKREGLFSKIPIALIGAVAMGVRTGIKKTGMSNGSIKVEGNFMKDLSNTITDSLKSAKVNVDISHVGETKSSADPHAGGHH